MTGLKIMFDTCAYNNLSEDPDVLKVIDGAIRKGCEFFVTHVQVDEIAEIPDKNKEKRKRAILFLAYGRPQILKTESSVWDHSRWDFSKWGSEASVYSKLYSGKERDIEDALIGATAFENGCILVTDDKGLTNRMVAIGGAVKKYSDFKRDLF